MVWLTGLSGSGKSTIANHIDFKLHELKVASFLLDGDNVRHGLNASPERLESEYGSEFANRFGLSFAANDRSMTVSMHSLQGRGWSTLRVGSAQPRVNHHIGSAQLLDR